MALLGPKSGSISGAGWTLRELGNEAVSHVSCNKEEGACLRLPGTFFTAVTSTVRTANLPRAALSLLQPRERH